MRRTLAVAILLVGVMVACFGFAHHNETFVYAAQVQPPASGYILAEEPRQAPPAAAPAPVPVQPPGPVHVVTFVDITPLNKDSGTALCKQYAADTRKDPGATSVQVLAQTNRPNHLVIYEVWQNEAAFERHEALAHTKDFRAKMGPIIGAPFDQRPHYVVP